MAALAPGYAPRTFAGALLALIVGLLGVADARTAQGPMFAHAAAETQLYDALEQLGGAGLTQAILRVEELIAAHPNFRLAHLVHADLLMARAGRPAGAGDAPGESARLAELRAELRLRVIHHRQHPAPGLVPRYLLRLRQPQGNAIVVDAGGSRAYLFETSQGVPRLAGDYYTTIGKHGTAKRREGDKKTPVGTYYITSHISGARLPDLYGWGAFPINYPNEWDVRLGRSGNGIWLHGVPAESYARAPLGSDGCLALANPEIADVARRVRPGATPVVIAETIEWVAPEVLREEAEDFLRQLEQWRRDWESGDVERYLAHYARAFWSDGMDRAAWGAQKRRINAGKKWIKVRLVDVGVLRDPANEPLMVVTFDQHYRSSNLASRAIKRQYWVSEDGRWRIAQEALAGRPPRALPESFPQRTRYAAD